MSEERVVDPETGGEKGRKDIEIGFLDPLAMEELGRVASMGARKYEPFNYLKGFSWMLSINAMFRHIYAFLRGEDRDPESGALHLAHACWHCLSLVSFTLRKLGTDDRAPKIKKVPALSTVVPDVPNPHLTDPRKCFGYIDHEWDYSHNGLTIECKNCKSVSS